MSVSGVNFSGLSSGIDTESIITKLVSIEKQPEQIYTTAQKVLAAKQAAYNDISAKLLLLQSAALPLNKLRGFNVVTGTSSDPTVLTAAAATGAQSGQYNVTVTSLATAQNITTGVLASQTAALGYDGQIIVNGKTITIHATDNLQNVAASINGAGAGVTAAIIKPADGQFYLSIGSNNTGVAGKITLADSGNGTFLSNTLGLLSSTTALKNPLGTTGAASNLFADSTTSISTLLGQTTATSGTVTINGQAINLDFGQDSLSTIAAKISQSGIPGVSATVVAATDPISGATKQQLQINGTQSFTDTNNVLTNLGITQQSLATGREATKAIDAAFTINGLAATRSSNTITDAVSGLTLNLVKEGTSTVTVASDTTTIKQSINDYVQAFNLLVTTVQGYTQFDPSTNTGGVLLGDYTAQNIADDVTGGVTGTVPGIGGTQNSLAQIGITLNASGTLDVDNAALSTALTGNLNDLSKLFRADGTASSSQVQFVSASAKTQPTNGTAYSINITKPAAQGVLTAATAQIGRLAQDEVLTFDGTLFNSSSSSKIQVTLAAGSNLQDVVNTINNNSQVSAGLTASIVNGKLTLTTKGYGTAAQFNVKSGVHDEKDGNSTGLDNVQLKVSGVDVAGTINGEQANGIGQYLTGSQAQSTTPPYVAQGKALGLQLLITATTPGNYGSIAVTSGVANFANSYANTQTDTFNGTLTNALTAVQSDIDDAKASITDLDARAKAYETNLRSQFTAMEVAIANLKAGSSGLDGLLTNSFNSSSSTSK